MYIYIKVCIKYLSTSHILENILFPNTENKTIYYARTTHVLFRIHIRFRS